ncbi:carbon-nitrogen hydrolase [Methylomonas sp. MgM2]
MNKPIIACAVQQPCNRGRKTNLAYSIAQVEQAAKQNAELVVLPELHLDHYFCQSEDTDCFDMAQPIPGPTCETLSQVAKTNEVVIVSTIFEKRAPGLYHNTAVVFEKDGSIAGTFRKMHIPDDPGFYEKFYFTPGDLGFKPIATSVGKLGVLICWDQWYPEAARLMALAGADVLIYPTAIGWNPDDAQDEKARQLEAWITVQRGHAVANGLPLIACNRIGFEEAPDNAAGIQFWGHSFIVGPQGEFLSRADDQQDSIVLATLDPKRSEDVRRIWPFLRDRRIDAYSDISKRYID